MSSQTPLIDGNSDAAPASGAASSLGAEELILVEEQEIIGINAIGDCLKELGVSHIGLPVRVAPHERLMGCWPEQKFGNEPLLPQPIFSTTDHAGSW